MPTVMARDDRNRAKKAFRPEDTIDEVFAGANPNPERSGCPGKHTLEAAGKKALPIGHPTYEHLTQCSDCYREFRAYQRKRRRLQQLIWAASGAAAILITVVAVKYVVGRFDFGPSSRVANQLTHQPVLIDFRTVSATRGETGGPIEVPMKLPRTIVEATILLPIGSEPGRYEVRFVDPGGQVRFSRQVTARLKDFAVRVELTADLRSFRPGAYSLDIRSLNEDWTPHAVIIQ
jgi:predicted nucleic acid-binding Zn ribbon protein